MAQVTRPLTIWVDTLTQNVCGPRSFQVPVRVGSFTPGDTTIGFRRNDSVTSATIYITWDLAKIDLDDFVLTSGAIAEQTKVTVRKFREEGTLEILLGDIDNPFKIFSGTGPLFYLSGRVTAADTLGGLDGWILPADIELTSATRFTPEIDRAGFVRVVRDTTPQYTGHLAVTTAAFDTLRSDTVVVSVQNVLARRVTEISFSLAADSTFFTFVDTLETGMLAAKQGWQSKMVRVTADSVIARFVSVSELLRDGPLLAIVLRRSTDSAFDRQLTVTNFQVNSSSCLGKTVTGDSRVTAAVIKGTEPVMAIRDRADVQSAWRVTPDVSGESMTISGEGTALERVYVFDSMGRTIATQEPEYRGVSISKVRFDRPLAPGAYFVTLRSRNESVSKQFIFIK